MKKKLLILALMTSVAFGLSAQVPDYSEVEQGIQNFADELAKVLPFNASLGLDWSSAYIGQLPHFGVGLTVGAATMPTDAVREAFEALNITFPSELDDFQNLGVPFPMAALNGRLGGAFLPFDVGVKVGFIPADAEVLLPYPIDYFMAGGDIRFPILKGKGLLPALSVGAGYTYLRGGITVPSGMGSSDINLDDVFMAAYGGGPGTHMLTIADSDVDLSWEARVIEAKAQISKKLFIITPYAGVGVAYGFSKVSGGLAGDVTYDNGSGPEAFDADALNEIRAAFAALGYDMPDLSADGFLIESGVRGTAVRAFGGLSLNILLLKLDLSAGYNFTSGSYSAAANVRIQL